MLTIEDKMQIQEMFKGTAWRIEDINTISDDELAAKLGSCVQTQISNDDILIACDSLNFAQLYARAKLRRNAEKYLEKMKENTNHL